MPSYIYAESKHNGLTVNDDDRTHIYKINLAQMILDLFAPFIGGRVDWTLDIPAANTNR